MERIREVVVTVEVETEKNTFRSLVVMGDETRDEYVRRVGERVVELIEQAQE